MSPGIYMLTILVLPVTAAVVFAMKYAASYAAARARIAEDADARAAMARTADQLSAIGSALRALAEEQARQTRTLASIDTVLREVG